MNEKQIAAEYAVNYIEDGMIVGIGSGTTVSYFINKLSQRIKNQIQHVFPGDRFVISRVSLVAKAVKPNDVNGAYFRELSRTYRNPGLVVENLMKID